MSVSNETKFTFDVQGYLHLRQAMTPGQVAEYTSWATELEHTDLSALNRENPGWDQEQMNHPVSRIFDADPRFCGFLDHPAVEKYLSEFLGRDYRHIDNDLLYTYPGYEGGVWHRGIRPHPTGHWVNGQCICPMIKVFYCITDVGPDEGGFAIIPGSHKAIFTIDEEHMKDIPAQAFVFDSVKAGDIVLFNEALIHTGTANPSRKTRKTIIVNFGREDAGIWECYTPRTETLDSVSARQRETLTNRVPLWKEPILT